MEIVTSRDSTESIINLPTNRLKPIAVSDIETESEPTSDEGNYDYNQRKISRERK